MAPPRRTTARTANATPARNTSPPRRSTRGSSALPTDSPATRRSTRGASRQPADGIITSPNLPEVQTQQSYAYGSTKTPLLPDQLVASERMTRRQIASNLEAAARQAEQNFEEHAAQVKANFGQTNTRAERAPRRGSREESREGSVDSETRKTRRTAAWASSLEDSQLENISEEGGRSEEAPDDDNDSRRGTDPSSFPSGIYDHSYNYERGSRGPLRTSSNVIGDFLSTSLRTVKGGFAIVYDFLEQMVLRIRDLIIQMFEAFGEGVVGVYEWIISPRFLRFVTSITIGALVLTIFCTTFCKVYTIFICNPDSTSFIQLTLQEYCGQCSVTSFAPTNLTFEERKDLVKLSKTLAQLTQRIKEAEARMDAKFDSKHADLIYSLDDLGRQHRELQGKIANIETRQPPSSDYSPLMQKINYFAPGTGAVVNPYRTSPTKAKPLSPIQKIGTSLFGLHKYTSNPPSSALEPWEDIGDCWCSASTHAAASLGVDMGHLVYPTEVVIEHYPARGLITPNTTPRHIEIWADFAHLTPQQWDEVGIPAMESLPSISPTLAKIGQAVYDSASKSHVQTFRLDVNQEILRHSTDKIMVRVVSNYGADYTCLYRVRIHGVAVVPHSQAQAGTKT